MGHQNVRINGSSDIIDVTGVLDNNNAYASGDLLIDTQIIPKALRIGDGTGILESLVITDEDDQGAAFDIFILEKSTSLGTINGTPNISDANSRLNFLAHIAVGTGDWQDLGGVRVACYNSLSWIIKAAAGTQDVYFAVVNGTGTPTYTASGLRFRFGFLQD